MRHEDLEYMNSLGMTEVAIARASEIVAEILSVHGDEDVVDFFVSETGGPQRTFQSLWVVTAIRLSEAKSFMTAKNIDFTLVSNKPYFVELTYNNYNLQAAQMDSALRVHANIKDNLAMLLFASGTNCDKLMQFAKKYLLGGNLARI